MAEENRVQKEEINFKKGKLVVNLPRAIAEFESAMHSLPVKQVLYKALFRGKGLEFDSYRQFEPMDDADLIDWRASLRTNSLLVRKYIEERNLNVFFVVDVSNGMLFGSDKKLKAEYVAELVGALSHLVVSAGDRIGLVLFNEGVVKVLHPSNSKNQFALFVKFLSDSSFYGGGFDFAPAIDHLLNEMGSARTFVILISDFIHLKRSTERQFKLLGSKYETIALVVRDPMDERLPSNGQYVIQDPYSNRQMVLDSSLAAEKYSEMVLRQKAILKTMFRSSGIDFLELNTSKSFVFPVSVFLKSRALGGLV